jgi:hypothetical protein
MSPESRRRRRAAGEGPGPGLAGWLAGPAMAMMAAPGGYRLPGFPAPRVPPHMMTAAFQRPEGSPRSRVMRASLDHGVEVPSLAGTPPGTLLVRVLVTSICGSDLAGRCCATCAAGQWRGYTDEMNPDTMARPGGTGHEILGEVVDVVAPSSRAVGQRVLAFSTGYIRMVPSARAAFQRATGRDPDDVLPLQGGFCQCAPRAARAPPHAADPDPLSTASTQCCTYSVYAPSPPLLPVWIHSVVLLSHLLRGCRSRAKFARSLPYILPPTQVHLVVRDRDGACAGRPSTSWLRSAVVCGRTTAGYDHPGGVQAGLRVGQALRSPRLRAERAADDSAALSHGGSRPGGAGPV